MSALRGVPHPFPYQGSKRQLASQILGCIPPGAKRLIEPFAGSGAITLATAYRGRAKRFILNDIHRPLIELWRAIINEPERLADRYERLWLEQQGNERAYYDQARAAFNKSTQPHLFLYLLARCVKAAVRYNGNGEFNNSPDNRRLGMHPRRMRMNICRTSALLRGKTVLTSQDYQIVLRKATSEDVVYMDPPYQGVCDVRDHRYCLGVQFGEFASALEELNERHVPYIVSYDGQTGDKVHGQLLPKRLQLLRVEIAVGRSTQATLLGRNCRTVESLYLSSAVVDRVGGVPQSLWDEVSPGLFPRV